MIYWCIVLITAKPSLRHRRSRPGAARPPGGGRAAALVLVGDTAGKDPALRLPAAVRGLSGAQAARAGNTACGTAGAETRWTATTASCPSGRNGGFCLLDHHPCMIGATGWSARSAGTTLFAHAENGPGRFYGRRSRGRLNTTGRTETMEAHRDS